MRLSSVLISISSVALAMAAGASAEELTGPRNYAQAGLGVFTVADDDVTFRNGGTTTNDTGVSIAANALVGRQLTKYFSVEGDLGVYAASWDGFDNGAIVFVCDDDDDCLDPTITTLSLTVNGVLSAPMDAKFRPYVGVGGGFMRTSYNLDDVDADNGFGYLIKAGADVPIAGNLRVGLQYTYLGAPEVEFADGFATFDVAGSAVTATVATRF
ncbi:MAG: outer membrane beta-barrel protein [Pseudomonadota bacterium]